MDSLECAQRTGTPVGAVGGGFMLDPATTERGAEFGLDFGEFYGRGRGGVLGDVDADVVIASFVYFEPNLVRALWEAASVKKGAAETALAYAEACRAWGRDRIGDVDGLGELAGLLQRVVDAASPLGAPLFAGWRAMPLPEDDAGRAIQLLDVLRELRGGRHAIANLAGGIGPLEALLCAGPPEQAALFGWPEPYPELDESARAAHREAHDLTDRLMAPAFDVLDDGERDRLVSLVDQVGAAAAAP
jgi:hypothetical protein